MHHDTIGRPMEILLVEDSLVFARMAIGALRNGGVQHRLTWLSDGEQALDFLFRRGRFTQVPRPDVILLDLGLPKKDGREVLAEIKADDDLRQIPVVVLTASTAEEDLAVSEQLHVESYMTKPVDLEKFLDVIQKLSRFWQADMIVPAR